MTENVLRNILKEANEKEQHGLFIWPNWEAWERFGFEIQQEDERYESAISRILKGEDSLITIELVGISMLEILVLPVKQLEISESLFKHVLKICQEAHYNGPVTLIPSNDISEFC